MYPCVTVLIGGERGTQFHHVFPIRTCNNFLCHSWNETDREYTKRIWNLPILSIVLLPCFSTSKKPFLLFFLLLNSH